MTPIDKITHVERQGRHLSFELLGAPSPPYSQVRVAITVTVDLYGRFDAAGAETLARSLASAIDEAIQGQS